MVVEWAHVDTVKVILIDNSEDEEDYDGEYAGDECNVCFFYLKLVPNFTLFHNI